MEINTTLFDCHKHEQSPKKLSFINNMRKVDLLQIKRQREFQKWNGTHGTCGIFRELLFHFQGSGKKAVCGMPNRANLKENPVLVAG